MEKAKQFQYVNIVINPGASCYSTFENTLKEELEKNPNLEYSYIYHNKDEDNENDKHIHLVINSKGKPKRFTTLKNMFEGAHIEETTKARYKRCIQYLIHKNNPEKEQYKTSEVISNLKQDVMNEIMLSNGYDFEFFYQDKIFDYLEEFREEKKPLNILTFVRRFGLEAIKNYTTILREVIKDYQEEIKGSFKPVKSALEILWEDRKKELKRDYYLLKKESLIGTNVLYEEFERIEYGQFIEAYEKGWLDKELEEINEKLELNII